MITMNIRRLTPWSAIFWILIAAGVFSTICRFTQGLGPTTNLHDEFPWGLWIGFDILCGVALASGGFVVAASVYIFNLERYRPILRPAILTAFLGYLLAIFALMYDLGKPWNIWHPVIHWNPRSVMFEVGWCVMLYTTVLALEFSPMVFERLNLERPKKILHAITIPLVIAGVILSSLHQSSLGSLYLIVPNKLHPLWYSSTLPYLFFLSAVAVGPAMVTVESYYSSRAFRREIELPILSNLGKVTAAGLGVYLVLKVEDIVNLKLVEYLFVWSFEMMMFWAEILVGIILPLTLLLNPRVRSTKNGLFVSSLLVVSGVVLNRLNISLTAIEHYSPVTYFPSWMEISITLMIVALGFAAFRLAAKYLPVFPPETKPNRAEGSPVADPIMFIDVPVSSTK
jgi:Ni/Fe-hydrogenase subunit HybB-like protein